MTIDLGFSGQESDVNRACSAFGLDTMNYRAFPNNGPVLPAEPPPSEPAAAPPPASAATAPIVDEVTIQQRLSLPAGDSTQQRTAPALPAAPPPAAMQLAWPQATAPAPFPAGPSTFPLPQMPLVSAWPSEQNQPPASAQAGAPAGGFALLRQALPAAYTPPASPMPAFAMARAPLQPLPPSGVRPPEPRPAPAQPAANPESFGIAFGAAFNAAFGTAGAGAVGAGKAAGLQQAQS